MKTLIFTLIFTLQAFAATTTPPEITDPQIARQLVGVAQDIKNEQVIANAPDLQSCQQQYQQSSANDPNDPNEVAKLESCIQGKIGSKSGQQLADFSDKLNLETYKLIPSKSLQNITKYLTQKLYQSLTGVDIEERDVARKIQAMKFNNKKQVDHRDFYDLYKNQIAKNALAEVSRFCLMDFRRDFKGQSPTRAGNTFVDHWDDLNAFATTDNPAIDVKDDGSTSAFDNSTQGATAVDATTSYRDIMKNIFNGGQQGQIPDEKKLSNFFFFCGKKINELCANYERTCPTGSGNRTCAGGIAPPPAAAGGANPPPSSGPTVSGGAKACITKTRLTAYKRAMKASEDIVKGLTDNAGADIFLALDKNEMVKRYQRGAGSEKSLNELTNNASADFFNATQNDSTQEAEACIKDPSSCDQFVVVSDAETRIQQNTNLVYLAKREAELVRVRELVKAQGQQLEEYLEKNYPDLKDKKNDPNLANLISQRWDARRQAVIDEIKNKIAERQVTEAQANQGASSSAYADKKQETAVNNAKAALSEKTRLAQVVFFNNIISSSLKLKDASGKELGRNIQAFNNEVDSADTLAQGAFTNLRSTLGTSGNSGGSSSGGGLNGNESVTNIDFLDEFIGIPKDQNANGARSPARNQ